MKRKPNKKGRNVTFQTKEQQELADIEKAYRNRNPTLQNLQGGILAMNVSGAPLSLTRNADNARQVQYNLPLVNQVRTTPVELSLDPPSSHRVMKRYVLLDKFR